MATELDHLIVGCADLESGTRWMEDMLGKKAAGGGKHDAFSTHNAVWSLGSAYLELIAIDPDAPAPGRPRWFGLDEADVRDRLAMGPHLLNWAIRVDDAEAAKAAAPADLGEILSLSRGDLRWKVIVPNGGAPLHQGHIPLIIEWLTPHPAQKLADQGMRIASLSATRSETAGVEAILSALGADNLITLSGGSISAGIMAEVSTPNGNVSFVG